MIRFRLFALLLVCTACGSTKPPQQTYKPRPQPAPTRPATPSAPATGMDDRPTLPQANQGYVNWVDSERLMPVLEESKRLNKVVFVEFHASWCAPCKVMEEETMTQASVYNVLNQYYLNFRTDYDTEAGRTIADIYEVTKLPTVLFLNDQGVVLERYTGIVTPSGFERLHALVQSKK